MALFVMADAKASLSARLGHRTDVTDPMLQKYIDQAQYLIATNIRGVEPFDEVSPPEGLVIGQSIYDMVANFSLTQFWAISYVRNDTDNLLMHRGVYEDYLALNTVPNGVPSMWTRANAQFYLFQAPTKSTTLIFYYRRIPTVGTYEAGDEWFDTVVQVAQYYALADIGKASSRQDVKAGLPTQVQMALTLPMAQQSWEATYQSDMGVTPWSR